MIPDRLTRMVKIEIVVDGSDVPAVERLLTTEGASGWTAVPGLSGFGHQGRHQGRLLFNEVGGQTMLVTVVPQPVVDPLVAGLATLLEHRPGVMFVSDTYVNRPTYFAAEGNDGS